VRYLSQHPSFDLLLPASTSNARLSPATSVDEAMQIFMERRIRHLPVLDEGRLAGLISIGDVNRWMLSEREQEARQLRCYIQGDPACPV
jgi:predicted transcriptional regulator